MPKGIGDRGASAAPFVRAHAKPAAPRAPRPRVPRNSRLVCMRLTCGARGGVARGPASALKYIVPGTQYLDRHTGRSNAPMLTDGPELAEPERRSRYWVL